MDYEFRTRRRGNSVMKRKANIVNILLLMVTFFFGGLFLANIIQFMSTTDDFVSPRNGRHAQKYNDRFTIQTRPNRSASKISRSSRLRFLQTENVGPRYDTIHGEYTTIPPSLRVVHLDLKGAPPKLSYLRELFPLIWKAGGNALLIEYEDMFPYTGYIMNASALNAYSKQQILQLVSLAKENHLEIIPLVQTFGHMEHVLKLEEFSHLREVPFYPQSLCPSKPESFQIVKLMIDQIMEVHYDSKYIHIGCDEVFQLGTCSLCKEKMRKMQSTLPLTTEEVVQIGGDHVKRHQVPGISSANTNHQLYLEHVKRVASYVRDKSQGRVKPIIWDDMLRSISFEQLHQSRIANYVEPMVWVYVEDIDHFVDGDTWRKYSNLFSHLWVASAFKGAFGERLFIPNVLRHYHNHMSWLNVIKRERSSKTAHGRPIHFRGIALTGWSRYDHFAVLCELLPVAIPSLVLNLISVSSSMQTNESTKFSAAEILLKCPKGSTSELAVMASSQKNKVTSSNSITETALENDPHQFELRRCKFPGSTIYGAVGSLAHYKSEVEALDTTSRETQGWLTSYNIRHNYSSPWRLSETIGGHTYLVKALEDYRNRTSYYLTSVFEKSTVS